MIDRLPEHRPLPDDVRLRARQRLSEGMRPAPRAGRPVLIAAGVSVLAAGAVFTSQALLGGAADVAGPPMQHNGEFVGKDRAEVNHVERGKADPDVLARCAAVATTHPPAADWAPIATSRKNGTVLTAFYTPAGLFFCANTATTTTLSAPDAQGSITGGSRQVKILFTTPSGAMAGFVSPDVKILGLSRIGDRGTDSALPAVVDGLFLAPSGFTGAQNGTKALVDGAELAVRGVPKPTPSVVDRPLAAAGRGTPDEQKLGECLRDRPVPDADQFVSALTVRLSATTTMRTGRFENLLFLCVEVAGEPLRGTVHDLDDLDEVRGATIAAMPAFYDFRQEKSPEGVEYEAGTTFAAAGLLTDPRVASVTYTRPGAADVPASIADGTFVLAAPLIDRHPAARVVVRDVAGKVLETIKPKDVP
ncbi:hypothetical protein [Lentzea sp.]|uniref:hypothetical protein n=1 Tax=Lentzea sp. TaxID=56099 RepID=UPI002ED58861